MFVQTKDSSSFMLDVFVGVRFTPCASESFVIPGIQYLVAAFSQA